jgi:polyisoprenoid-binding protein YceI
MSTAATAVTGTWNVDPAHSRVGFAIKHLGISTVRGSFNEFEGTLQIGADLSTAKGHGTVQVASIDTGDAARDGHLLNADFFDAGAHPQITFEATRIAPTGEGTAKVTGKLTIMGTMREVEFDATVAGPAVDPFGKERVGLEVATTISRGDFGMGFNLPLESGGLALSDDVEIIVDVSAVKAV